MEITAGKDERSNPVSALDIGALHVLLGLSEKQRAVEVMDCQNRLSWLQNTSVIWAHFSTRGNAPMGTPGSQSKSWTKRSV